ncbi:MAG: hypothetical protein ABI182_04920 [Candidatus Baltobacteraceae bacterium]
MQPKEIGKPAAAWQLLLQQWIAFVVGWQAVSLVLLLAAHVFSLRFFATQTGIIALIVLIAFGLMGLFSRFSGGRVQGFGVATPWVVVIGAAGALGSLLLMHPMRMH